MATALDNFQPSLAITEYIPLWGIYPSPDSGSSGPTMGMVRSFAGNFAPNEAPEAQGQLLAISQNQALFSLLGTTFGGNGTTHFALPNLEVRTAIGRGQGPSLDNRLLGEETGVASIDLTQAHLPPALGGIGLAVDNVQPSLTLTYLIRVYGLYPSPDSGGTGFLGEVVRFAGNFAPGSYMEAAGQLLSIAEHDALFSLIGTTYGGDGQTTFALPDLRGRHVVGAGFGTNVGTLVGEEDYLVTQSMAPPDMGGSGLTVSNAGPGLAMTYLIALQGIFPSREGSGGGIDTEPILGEILAFAGTFAPRGWAKCEGQLLAISQHQALFSLLGTQFGGDGRVTFALPDLRGRTTVGASDSVPVGTVIGTSLVDIDMDNIPALAVDGDGDANTLYGGNEGDTLRGFGGSDTLNGNAGNDQLNGGADNDTVRGGRGNDTIYVDSLGDIVVEALGEGNDLVATSVSYTLGAGVEVETLRTTSNGGTANLSLTGNEFSQTIMGNAGNNVLRSGTGAPDTLRGLLGDDVYRVFNAGDQIIEAAGRGNDRVITTISYTLAAGISIEQFTTDATSGTANLSLTGNELAQSITGNAGNNVLRSGTGAADTLRGLLGNDTYRVFNVGDTIIEAAGQGNDRVITVVNYTLGAGVSIEQFTTDATAGTDNLSLTGNELAQSITGNAGDNRIDGRGGNDTLRGLAGDDTFVFNRALGPTSVDTIVDFNVADDRFLLSDAIFTAIVQAPGVMASGYFKSNAAGAATDANDRIIYDTSDGRLLYDADGDGAGNAIHFATITAGLALTFADFSVA